jgi:hypothetical protein
MIAYEDALEMANEYLRDSDVPLQITHQEVVPEGWLFCFNSKEYIETGNFSAQLAGNGPFLIDKNTGKLTVFGTAQSPDKYLEEYRKHDSKAP